jgi:hypothetical protein
MRVRHIRCAGSRCAQLGNGHAVSGHMKLTLGTLNRPAAVALAAVLALLAVLMLGSPAADAAKKKPCTRGHATLVAVGGGVRVVRVKVKKQSSHETRREYVLACWAKTGKRTIVSREVDFGLDNIARTQVEIVDGRYVGVREQNEGGVSESDQARVYDARTGKLLHTSKVCEDGDTDDHVGVDDAAFLPNGGLAMACRKLVVYRNATSALETLEPEGTWVLQIAVSKSSFGFGPRLFWVLSSDGGLTTTTKSAAV